jgi:tripartite-type tricarboxylate transporter receptor subunit TctC
MLTFIHRLASTAAAITLSLTTLQVSAQSADFPNRPIRMIVPFPAGGPTDILARVVGQKMSEQLGQPILIDNRPGANTSIGASAVAKAPADGYTLLMAIDNTLTMNQFLYSKLPYDPAKDFDAIGKVAVSPLILVTGSKGPASLPELLTRIKANPGQINYGHGTFTTQFAGEMLRREVGKEMVDVPYKGSSAVTQGLLSNDVVFTIDGVTAALPHIQKGTFHAVARLSGRALPPLPRVPALAEAGVKLPDIEVWMALVAPRGLRARWWIG